jgi:hypothetical protein
MFEAVFGHVGDKHGGLGRDQKELLEQRRSSFAEVGCAPASGFIEHWHFSRMVTSLADSVARPPAVDAVQGFFSTAARKPGTARLDDLDVRDQSTLPRRINILVQNNAPH